MTKVAIGLGSNLGDRMKYLVTAYRRLRELLTEIDLSKAHLTPPVGLAPNQPAYLNAVVVGYTTLQAEELLNTIKRLEIELGRSHFDTGLPREIDLDLLLFGDEVLYRARALCVPHPRLSERWFALAPLVELWPEARHPLLEQTVSQLLTKLERPAGVEEQLINWHLDV